MKPALARGTLRCIGATTLNEYRQYIERDGALERRFQMVFVVRVGEKFNDKGVEEGECSTKRKRRQLPYELVVPVCPSLFYSYTSLRLLGGNGKI